MTNPDPENPTRVQKALPMDVNAIRDPGMKALVLLAASLGWNIIHKPNNPILLKARDGRERRIPTNTSIRMSVFQANLSTILTHSPGYEPTAGLIDDIVRKTKIDRDHERRLRLAVTEPEEVHRARLANLERGVSKRDEMSHEEHLTQRIDMTPAIDPRAEERKMVDETDYADLDMEKWDKLPDAPDLVPASTEGPFDGQDHGKLISRKPYMAKYHGSRRKPGVKYPSETSYERVWEDDYKDYECIHCGMVKATPQAVGSHKQIHVKAGEIEASPPSAVMARTKGVLMGSNVPYAPAKRAPAAVPPPEPQPTDPQEMATDAEKLVALITELIAPNLRDRMFQALRERDELQAKYDALEANWKALRELINLPASD